jgi:plasmid stability protein
MTKMLQVRNVPDDVHAELKRRAARNHQSLSDFLLRELERLAQERSLDEIFAEVEKDGAKLTWDEILDAIHDGRGEQW